MEKIPKQKKGYIWDTQDIWKKRITYLRSVKRFRNEERLVAYLDESYSHSTHMQSQSWADEQLPVYVFPSQREIYLYMLVARKCSSQPLRRGKLLGDYHGNVNQDIFMKWLTQQFVPNLEPRSLLVVDNAPYHNEQGPPHKTKKTGRERLALKIRHPFRWLHIRSRNLSINGVA